MTHIPADDDPLGNVREPSSATIKFRDELEWTPDLSGDQPGYTIEVPLRGKYFRVGFPEFAFLSQLDGQSSIAEAVGRAAVQLGHQALNEHDALALCRWALECQLAQSVGGDRTTRIAAAAARRERLRVLAVANPLCIRIPLVDPEPILSRLAWLGRWVFMWPAMFVWIVLIGYAIYLASSGWEHLEVSGSVILDRDNWFRLAVAWILLKILHETAHGLACKHYGGTVGSAGVTLLFFMPLAYIDVTSSWRFASKWQRIVTAAAGIYAELFVAAIAIIVWTTASPGVSQTMALNIALTAGVSTLLFNANPLVRFDGYFILSDLLEIPNLSSWSQQWIANCVQTYLLGRETATRSWPRAKAWFICGYAIAATIWRVVFFLTMALVLIGSLGYLGMATALILLGFAWGIPLGQTVYRLRQAAARQPMNGRRVATSIGVVAVAIALAGFLLMLPGRITAPAVVEYSPLNIVRASTPGYVEKILVASGDAVVMGQPIAVLRNDELNAELADLELASDQSLAKSRMFAQAQELAKLQVENADREALEKKIAQLRSRITSLTLRASAGGRIHGRQLDALGGRYLQTGDEIAVIGSEEAKELLVAVSQDDVELFGHRLSHGDVRVRTSSGDRVSARLSSIDPRGSSELPHAALSVVVGGPLAVKPIRRTLDAGDKPDRKYELVSPVFQAKVALSADEGRRLHAGQLVTVSFRAEEENVATRFYRILQRWMARCLYPSQGE